MATLSPERMQALLQPYFPEPEVGLLNQLSTYLDLLVRWNERTNLTAIRQPEEMVTRHFGESLFTALHLPEAKTLLDLGSGAGFPGLPIQLARPELHVTLAESQGKKASFLREVVRVLGLDTEVWAGRAEALPKNRRFDVVTLRAVDQPEHALHAAQQRVVPGGVVAHLTTATDEGLPVPGSEKMRLVTISFHRFHTVSH